MLLFCRLTMVCKATQEVSLYFLNDKHLKNDKIPLLMFLIIISGFSFLLHQL